MDLTSCHLPAWLNLGFRPLTKPKALASERKRRIITSWGRIALRMIQSVHKNLDGNLQINPISTLVGKLFADVYQNLNFYELLMGTRKCTLSDVLGKISNAAFTCP